MLTVIRVDTYDDALKLVNDNQYGNGTAIFTRDGGAARQYQFDVNVGMVGINVPIPVPVAVLQLRRLEGLALRRPPHVRPRGHPVLYAGQGRDLALAGPRHLEGRPRLPADALARESPQPTMAIEERTRVQGVTDWRPRPTLTGSDYASPDVYEEERERLFYRGWFCIGRADEVPASGDYLVRDVVGESVFVVRNRDGALRAFYNVCAHRGTKLLDDEPACGQALARRSSARITPGRTTSTASSSATPNVHEDEQFERCATTRLHARSRSGSTAASCS